MSEPRWRLRLPPHVTACCFDLDGVLTPTAELHARAWAEVFDDLLRRLARREGVPLVPFDAVGDYAAHVDGRLREDGVRAFLRSRGIELEAGGPDDDPSADTVRALAARKDRRFSALLARGGVRPYAGVVGALEAARDAGRRLAVVSASRHCAAVLAAAGLDHLFDVRVDGEVAARLDLQGKPAPDTYLFAARELGVAPAAAAVFEDATSGIDAAVAGGFGWIVGVDRRGAAAELRCHGAHLVVGGIGELVQPA